jgi:hypothetical protein
MSDIIEQLKKLPPLKQQVCGSCEFYKPSAKGNPNYISSSGCTALSDYAKYAWERCQGRYWQPKPLPVSLLVRFKRYLIG